MSNAAIIQARSSTYTGFVGTESSATAAGIVCVAMAWTMSDSHSAANPTPTLPRRIAAVRTGNLDAASRASAAASMRIRPETAH